MRASHDGRYRARRQPPGGSTLQLVHIPPVIQHPQLIPPHNTVHALHVAASGFRSGRRVHPSLPAYSLYKVQASQNKVKPFVLGVEPPGDPRGKMTGTRYSSVQKLTQSAWRPLQSSGEIQEDRTGAARSFDGLRILCVDGHST